MKCRYKASAIREYGADKFGFMDLGAVNWNLLEPELYERALA